MMSPFNSMRYKCRDRFMEEAWYKLSVPQTIKEDGYIEIVFAIEKCIEGIWENIKAEAEYV